MQAYDFERTEYASAAKKGEKKMKFHSRSDERGASRTGGYGTPSMVVDDGSFLRKASNTKMNIRHEIKDLPVPTSPGLFRGGLQTDVEDTIARPVSLRDQNSCIPADNKFYNRTFQIFDKKLHVPNGDITTSVQKNESYRQGIDTRHKNQYRH